MVVARRKRVKEEWLQGKLEAQQGQQVLAPDSSSAADPLWDSGSPRAALERMLRGICSVPCCLEYLSISSLMLVPQEVSF